MVIRLTTEAFLNEDTNGLYFDNGKITSDGNGNLSVANINDMRSVKASPYNAYGDGIHDDTAAIQAAFTAAGQVVGSVVMFPAGVYLVSATLKYPGNISIVGAGDNDNGTVIRVATGTNLSTPILASSDWFNNSSTCGNPVIISGIKFDGNSATTGTAAHGVVMMNYWSVISDCSINNVAGDGLRFTAHSQNGTHISNTCVEAKIRRLQVRTTGGTGIRVFDSGSPLNSCTDGFLEDCIVQGAGADAITIDMGLGWYIAGNHIYGTVTNGISVLKCYATRVMNNYIDGYGSGSSANIAGISMSCGNGRGSCCIGNHIGFENSSATGPYQAFTFTGNGNATTVLAVMGNTVNGNNGTGSLGYVVQTQPVQQATPWIVYFHDNDAQNVATYSFVDSFVTGGDLCLMNHITTMGPVPTAVAGANAGTTPPAPAVNTSATDIAGRITFGTGTVPAAGAQVVVTLAKTFIVTPYVVLTPNNSATASLNLYVTSTANSFTVSCVTAPAASQANTVYSFNYHVISHR